MVDFYTEIVKFISDNIIKGIFFSVLLVVLTKLILKKLDVYNAKNILKWTIIVYSIGVIIGLFLLLIFPHSEKYSFINRATGPYWWAYWLMLTMNSIFPLLLLFKKLGDKIYFLLFVSMLMNIGWFFESFVSLMTSLNYDDANYNPSFLNSREISIIIKGLVFGFGTLVLGNIIEWKKTETYVKKLNEKKSN
jgi:hypothetical protein